MIYHDSAESLTCSTTKFATTMARLSALCLTLACWLGVLPVASGQNDATTHPVQEIPTWAVDASLALTLTTSGDASPLQYTVIPLTPAVGLNESNTALRVRLYIPSHLTSSDRTFQPFLAVDNY